jgi:anti-sigma28 factor (negative regulator of flagellin synthesis)
MSIAGEIIDLGRSRWKVVEGNCIKCAESAAVHAAVTGSIGATEIHYSVRDVSEAAKVDKIDESKGDRWAKVERIKDKIESL